MSELEIENLLRQAPPPAAPAGLKEQLQHDILLPHHASRPFPRPSCVAPWWRRWIPTLVFGMINLLCLVLLAMQTSQIMQLKRDNAALRAAAAPLEQLRQQNQALQQVRQQAEELALLRRDNLELQQLRAEVAKRQGQVAPFDQVRAENQRLKAEQAALLRQSRAGGLVEVDPFAEARAKAKQIQCVNDLKQIALAARIWAGDNKDLAPKDFLSMSNELATPKVLVCPADTGRKPATNWAGFTLQNVSYEMLSPGADDKDPEVVFARCPIHNNVALMDGSVQSLGATRQVTDVEGKKKIILVVPPPNQPALER
jgi:hypothetical protein